MSTTREKVHELLIRIGAKWVPTGIAVDKESSPQSGSLGYYCCFEERQFTAHFDEFCNLVILNALGECRFRVEQPYVTVANNGPIIHLKDFEALEFMIASFIAGERAEAEVS